MTGNRDVTIRIWAGCAVIHVVRVGPTGSVTMGAVSGAENSTRVDIELDPWRGLVVDNRTESPSPRSIWEGGES